MHTQTISNAASHQEPPKRSNRRKTSGTLLLTTGMIILMVSSLYDSLCVALSQDGGVLASLHINLPLLGVFGVLGLSLEQQFLLWLGLKYMSIVLLIAGLITRKSSGFAVLIVGGLLLQMALAYHSLPGILNHSNTEGLGWLKVIADFFISIPFLSSGLIVSCVGLLRSAEAYLSTKKERIPSVPERSSRSSILRSVCIAFLLGLFANFSPYLLLYVFVTLFSIWSPSLWQITTGGPLVGTLLLSMLLDPAVRRRRISLPRVASSLLLVLLLAALFIELVPWGFTLSYELGIFLGIVRIPFFTAYCVGFAAAAVGNKRTWKLALASSVVAWIGSILAGPLAEVLFRGAVGIPFVGAVLGFAVVGIPFEGAVLGFAVAACSGILSYFLRVWMLRPPAQAL